jgi:general secretion pathway protein G
MWVVFMELNYYAPTLYHRTKGWSKALTLIELLLTIAILGILSAIAVPIWTGYMDDSRNATAKADIANITSQIERFKALNNGTPPNTLGAAGIVPPLDPWGRAYIYVYPPVYWDKHDKPLNKDYDILSIGKDGLTNVHLWHSDAFDDIIRCNSGAFIGLASEY